MRLTAVTQAWARVALLGTAVAWPGMNKTLNDLGLIGTAVDGDSYELLGDLATLAESELTPVGQSIKNIITGTETGQSSETWHEPIPDKESEECKVDICCVWNYIATDLSAMFVGKAGRCNAVARAAIRLGLHDPASWSKSTGGTGADGSIIISGSELSRPENNGLQAISALIAEFHDKYQDFDVSHADLIQMASTVATVVCPLGPRIRSFVGRKDSTIPAAPGLLPDPLSDADTLIALFQDKTIGPHGLAALIGAHTTSQQFFVDPSRAGDPQDSTPGVWDATYYWQTLGRAPPRVFRFPSDVNIARDPRTSPDFRSYASDQERWNEDYAREYVRLSLLGVYNINELTECTKVLPQPMQSFQAVDQDLLDGWLGSTETNEAVADAVLNGDALTGMNAVIDGLKKIGKRARKMAKIFSA